MIGNCFDFARTKRRKEEEESAETYYIAKITTQHFRGKKRTLKSIDQRTYREVFSFLHLRTLIYLSAYLAKQTMFLMFFNGEIRESITKFRTQDQLISKRAIISLKSQIVGARGVNLQN